MKDTKLRLRNARPKEADEVALLLVSAYKQYAESMPAPAWDSYVQDISDVRSRMAVADVIVGELDKRLVGTVTLYLDTSCLAGLGWPEGWAGIRLLGVHPYRGQGIGRALMDECILRCRKRRIKTIGLYTTKMMEVAARMYERMGFRRACEFDHWWSTDIFLSAYRLDL